MAAKISPLSSYDGVRPTEKTEEKSSFSPEPYLALIPPAPALKATVNPTYKEMTRRIPPEELTKIEAEVAKVKPLDLKQLLLAMQNLKKGPWDPKKSPILVHKDLFYIVLRGVKEGKIKQNAAATLLLFQDTYRLHMQIEGYEGFIEGSPPRAPIAVPISSELGRKALKNMRTRDNGFFLLSPEEEKAFFLEVAKLPPLEQQILFVPSEKFPHRFDPLISFNILHRVYFSIEGKTGWHAVPSVGIMQAYLNVKFKGNAVKINPIYGWPSVNDISQNGLKNMRDMAITTPQIDTPMTVDDGLFNRAYFATAHDFYHAGLASTIPEAHRKLFAHIGKLLGLKVTNRFTFFDMEFLQYTEFPDKRAAFWEIIAYQSLHVGKPENRAKIFKRIFAFLDSDPEAQKAQVSSKDFFSFAKATDSKGIKQLAVLLQGEATTSV